jgi:hypothetical protein
MNHVHMQTVRLTRAARIAPAPDRWDEVRALQKEVLALRDRIAGLDPWLPGYNPLGEAVGDLDGAYQHIVHELDRLGAERAA